MTYRLGIDVGTTFTAAAVRRAGRTSLLPLGGHGAEIPSVLFLREDGTFTVGEAAERRGLAQPERLVREFKRRTGDPTPLLLAGSPFSPHALTAVLLRHVMSAATVREGQPPSEVVLTHPAHWGPHKREQLQHAVELADLPQGTLLCPEPVAALVGYADLRPVSVEAAYAVYDLGGGTFDAAVVRSGAQGVRLEGRPAGVEQLGGVDFDDALFHEVLHRAGVDEDDLAEDPAVVTAIARLRRDCVAAKEALSDEDDITVLVTVPGHHTSVRVDRADFEDLVRPTLLDTVAALHRALRSAQLGPDDLAGVLLAGGSSRMPLVTELLSAELGRPVLRDAHPKHVVPLGAAALPSEPPPPSPPPPPTPPPDRERRGAGAGRTPPRPAGTAPPSSPPHGQPDTVGVGAPGPPVAGPAASSVPVRVDLDLVPAAAPGGRRRRLLALVAVVAVLGLAAAGARLVLGPRPDPTAGRLPPAPGVVRYEGADRYSTSAAAALAVHDRAASAVLASGEGHADALVAQALAGATDGGVPFLLTDPGRLPAVTTAALRRLGVRDVVLVGDPTAVSSGVQRSLEGAGIAVTRLEGPLRADTALAVARALRPTTVLLADGDDPAAVGVGPIAYRHGWPVLYWSSRGVPPEALDLLDDEGVQVRLVETGGRLDQVREQLRAAGVAVEPLVDGPVAGVPLRVVAELGWSGSRLTLVTDGPDALSAAQVAAREDAPMLVTGPADTLGPGAAGVLQDWPGVVDELFVVGDATTVTPGVLERVVQELEGR